MKRFLIVLMLSAALLTGCHKSEPSTVATVSPVAHTVMTDG